MQMERKYKVGFDSEWDLSAIREALDNAHQVVLVAHTNADGDAVGSLLGMYHILTSANRQIQVAPMLPDGVPDELQWLPGTDKVMGGADDMERCAATIHEADLIIGVDISGLGRTGRLEESLRASKARKILVDHHIGPEREVFDTVVSEPEASSACEVVYWLMLQVWGADAFNTDAATCLYTGINTDTGSFSFSNDRTSVYLAAGELLHYGIDPMYINRQIKNIFTEARMRFFGWAISQRLTVYGKQKVALMVLSAKEMREGGVQSSELTGLINDVMKLRDVDCGVLIREDSEGGEKVRLSLRSKEMYDVNLLAGEMFGGGGHKRAAGATSNVGLAETVRIVKERLKLED